MHVTVRLFAGYRERVGASKVELELSDGATLADAWEALTKQHSGLSTFDHDIVGSVNADYASPDTELHDGDEIAFIPPVAGGTPVAGGAPAAGDYFAIVDDPIDDTMLHSRVADPGAGAILSFLGVTRNQTGGRQVEHLEYEAYEPLAIKQMQQVADEIRARWPDIKGVVIVHRVGRLEIGEASIGIAVSSPHRADAFAACRYAIDRAKESLPVWKKEVWEGGEEWIEEGPGVTG